MLKNFLAKKGKMTQVYLQDGRLFGITVLHTPPATILQLKTTAHDGYNALRLGFGQPKKTKTTPFQKIKEIKISSDDSGFKLGDKITIDQILQDRDLVKVTGFSRGRGFAGVIKRHGFHSQPATHGQSDRERTTGSIGPQTPGKVIKGKKMPGHFGNSKASLKNIKILKVDPTAQKIYLIGSVPGSINSWIEIEKTGQKAPESFHLAPSEESVKDKENKKDHAKK